MENILTGQRVNSPEGPGEVLTVFGDKVVIKLDNGSTTTLADYDIQEEYADPGRQYELNTESPKQTHARAEHASEILARLDGADIDQSRNNILSKQIPMEISEKAIEVINDLIEINNDRVEGFEKASRDLEESENGLTAVFNKLANESRQNAGELTHIVQQYGGEPAEGTSTSGALHRAWIDVKSVFTGGDLEAILNECETGEDAIKASYQAALADDNELSPELVQVLQQQHVGIMEGHELIKSLRNQVRAEVTTNDAEPYGEEDENYNDLDKSQNTEAIAEPAYEGSAGDFRQPGAFAEESAGIDQNDQQPTLVNNSKLMEFFVDELKDLLWAEKELIDTLPDMAEAATSEELKKAFTDHLYETEEHVSRLEQIFGILGLEPDTTKCDAMAGIVEEGDNIISHTEEGTAQRDVGLIFAGQKAEHYEIASYGGMISLAKTLGYYEIAELLVLTIDEEKTADALLTEIAESHINYEASTEPAE